MESTNLSLVRFLLWQASNYSGIEKPTNKRKKSEICDHNVTEEELACFIQQQNKTPVSRF